MPCSAPRYCAAALFAKALFATARFARRADRVERRFESLPDTRLVESAFDVGAMRGTCGSCSRVRVRLRGSCGLVWARTRVTLAPGRRVGPTKRVSGSDSDRPVGQAHRAPPGDERRGAPRRRATRRVSAPVRTPIREGRIALGAGWTVAGDSSPEEGPDSAGQGAGQRPGAASRKTQGDGKWNREQTADDASPVQVRAQARFGRRRLHQARVKRWGKSPPHSWRHEWHAKPHPEQHRIGTRSGFGRAGRPVRACGLVARAYR